MKIYGNWLKDEEDGTYYNLNFVKRISVQQTSCEDYFDVTFHTHDEVQKSIEIYLTLEEAQKAMDELFEQMKKSSSGIQGPSGFYPAI